MLPMSISEVDVKNMKLPFQPHVVNAIIRLQSDSMMNFHDLDNLIKSDPNLTTLILKVANSSFYFRGNEVRTLQQAIGMIGFQTVISFAVTASVKNVFEQANYTRFKRFVWQHSIFTGIAAKCLAERLGYSEQKEEAFIAGTLHDIGKVVLNNIDRKEFIEVIHEATEGGATFHDVEKKRFGFDHTEVGRLCIENWKLPALYRVVVEYHNRAVNDGLSAIEDEAGKRVFLLVCYGHFLAKYYGYGHITSEDSERLQEITGILNISEEEKSFFEEGFLDVVKGDPFYKFFITLV